MLYLQIPRGDAGIAHTVSAMFALMFNPRSTAELRATALWICREAGVDHKDGRQVTKAIYDWVDRNVEYVKDPVAREFVQPPLFVLRRAIEGNYLAAEDCDGHAVINGALLASIGYPIRLCLIEDKGKPGLARFPRWAHVHVEALVKGPGARKPEWTPIDTSLWFVPYGQRAPGRYTFIHSTDVPLDRIMQEQIGTSGDIDGGDANWLRKVWKFARQSHPSAQRAMRDRANLEGSALGQLSLATGVIQAGSGALRAMFGSRAQSQVAKYQSRAMITQIEAERDIARSMAEMEQAAVELERERGARFAGEQAAFARLARSENLARTLPVAAGSIAGLGLVGYLIHRLRSR